MAERGIPPPVSDEANVLDSWAGEREGSTSIAWYVGQRQ